MKRFKNERGLTLVELLAVVVILAIIAVIAFVLIGNVIDNSKKDAHIANAQQLIASAKLYEANGKAIETNGVGAGQLKAEGLLDKIIDPWSKKEYSGIGANDLGTNGIVTKNSDGEYSVTLNASKCNLPDVSEQKLIEDGREVCK